MSGEGAEDAGDAAPVPAPLVGEVQAGPLAPLAPDFYAMPVVPAFSEGLAPKARAWLDFYLSNGMNAAAAARAVGLSAKRGAALRHDPRVIKAIEAALSQSGASRVRVLEEITALALSTLADVAEIIDGKMVVRDTADMSEQAKKSLSSIKCDPLTGIVISVSADLKGAALNLLAKALRLVGSEPAISIQTDGPVRVILSKEDQSVL